MNIATQRGNNVLGQYVEIENRIGIALFKPEARIILFLKERGSLSVKEVMLASGLSYRGFYLVFNRLVQQQIVEVENDPADRRVRRIRLTEGAVDKLDEGLAGIARIFFDNSSQLETAAAI